MTMVELFQFVDSEPKLAVEETQKLKTKTSLISFQFHFLYCQKQISNLLIRFQTKLEQQ